MNTKKEKKTKIYYIEYSDYTINQKRYYSEGENQWVSNIDKAHPFFIKDQAYNLMYSVRNRVTAQRMKVVSFPSINRIKKIKQQWGNTIAQKREGYREKYNKVFVIRGNYSKREVTINGGVLDPKKCKRRLRLGKEPEFSWGKDTINSEQLAIAILTFIFKMKYNQVKWKDFFNIVIKTLPCGDFQLAMKEWELNDYLVCNRV